MRELLRFVIVLALLPQTVAAEDRPLVAVLPFAAIGVSDADAQGLSLLFETAMQRTYAFTIIEQAGAQAVLQAQERSLHDCTDEKCAVEIGRLLAANRIVLGTVGKIGDVFFLNVKMVDIETATNILSDKIQGSGLVDRVPSASVRGT